MAPIAVAWDHAGGSQQPGKFSHQSTLNFPSCGGSSTSITTDSNAPLDPLFLTSENMGYDCHDNIFLPSKSLIYPSPPSTEFQHPVALPAGESSSPPSVYVWILPKPDQPACSLVSFPSTTCYGGLLDSPLVMHHTALKSQAPLSPPPTQPTSTLALPPTDAFHDVTHAASSSSSCLSPILSAQCLSPILSGADSLDGTDPASSSSYQPTTSCLKSEGVDPLLSPLSPEWDSNSISHMQPTESPEHSYLLRDTPFTSTSSPPLRYHQCEIAGPSYRPFLPLLDIPNGADPYPMQPPDIWDDPSPESMQVDHDYISRKAGDPSTALSPLSTPSISPSTPPPILDEIDSDLVFREPWIGYFQHPNSPSIPHLPSIDDEDMKLSSPSSPSMRSFTLLPTDDDAMSVSPSSPGLPVLSLPGADTDDDLLSEELGPSRPTFAPNSFFVPATLSPTSRSLLLLDDPNDVPPPRSPSPENFHLDPALLAEYPDPDLQKLHDLRRRAQAAERAARQRELNIIEEDGFIPAASEARRAARREKERGREVAALLRLKLNGSSSSSTKNIRRSSGNDDEEARSPPSPSPSTPHSSPPRRSKKPKITSVPQLVAKMIFSRREPRSPVGGRGRMREHGLMRSPLSRTVDDEDGDEDDGAWAALRSPSWGMDGGSGDLDLLPAL